MFWFQTETLWLTATGKATGGAIDHSDTLISHRANSTFVPLVRCTKMPLPSWKAQSHKGEGYTSVAYPCRAWQRTGKNHFESICGSRTGEECLRSLLSKFECICWQGRAYNSGAIHVHTMAIASGGRSYGRKGASTPDSIMLLCHQGWKQGSAIESHLVAPSIRLLGQSNRCTPVAVVFSPTVVFLRPQGRTEISLQRATLDSASEARRM